jgi:hypothetical protein
MMNAQAGGTYLYAVLAHSQELGEAGSIGIEGGEVYCVTAGGIAAAVSRVSRARLRPERKHLLAHQAVLRRLMEQGTVLPAAFGLVARSDEAVRGLLLDSAAQWQEQLEHVAGKVEMGLRVSWNAPDLFEYFVAAHPELRAARERIQSNPGLGREELIEVGKLFERLREADRAAHSARVEAALQELAAELKWNEPRGDREVLSLSCLVPREAVGAFDKAVEALAASFDDHFAFELQGPLPPHSFTELKSTARPERG